MGACQFEPDNILTKITKLLISFSLIRNKMIDTELSVSINAHVTDRDPNRNTKQQSRTSPTDWSGIIVSAIWRNRTEPRKNQKNDKYYDCADTQFPLKESHDLLIFSPALLQRISSLRFAFLYRENTTISLETIIAHRM